MSAEKDFFEENLLRATTHATRARVAAELLAPMMREVFPDLFPGHVSLTPIANQGWTNLTLRIEGGNEDLSYILRLAPCGTFPNSRSTPALEKERYVLEKLSHTDLVPKLPAHPTGRLTLSIPSVGDVAYGYLLESFLPFEAPRSDTGPRDRLSILRQLGEVCKALHGVTLSGFGVDFEESTSGFRHASYRDVLAAKIEGIEHAPLDPSMQRWLIARVESLAHLGSEPRLFHRDLLGNWGNFLVDESRNVRGIIDWEMAGSGPAFHYEIAALIYVLTRDGHSPDLIEHDLKAVLEGYGTTLEHYKRHYEREVETLVLLNSVSALERYELLKKNGGITREPWRKLFAERASMICARSYRGR
jgi:aminoglycoside phosphotransferase (APT) family kinase protein